MKITYFPIMNPNYKKHNKHSTNKQINKQKQNQLFIINDLKSIISFITIISQMKLSKLCGWYSQDKILSGTDKCTIHKSQFMYLCLNQQPQCREDPLMCPACLQTHKGHHFQSLNNYFTPQFKTALKSGTSANGHAIARLQQHVLSDIDKMKAKLNHQIDNLATIIKQEISKLKIRYPLEKQFHIPGTQISKENIGILMEILEKQKKRNWVPSSEKYIRSLLGQVTIMITNLLTDLQEYFTQKDWQSFNEQNTDLMIQQFIDKYSQHFDSQQQFFKFSPIDKHYNIKLNQARLLCQYLDPNPSHPAILTQNSFHHTHDTVYFMVSKMEKTLKIFDASLILVGACNPVMAKTFGFRSLLEPAHGAYMIGSNGKSYHSNSTKYDKKSLAVHHHIIQFEFGQNDVIAVKIDYQNKIIQFSKFGFFQRKFKMQLQCKNDDLLKLKPCVLFHGEKGAQVSIVDQLTYKHKEKDQDVV